MHLADGVEGAVEFAVAQDGLDVLSCLGVGDGLDELVNALIRPGGLPIEDAIISGVVGGQGILGYTAELVESVAQIAGSEADVGDGVEQLEGLEVIDSLLARQLNPVQKR